MNIIFDICIYVLTSSIIMVGYVWFKSIKHARLGYDQMLESMPGENAQPAEKSLAA